jgi:hypothetical protein
MTVKFSFSAPKMRAGIKPMEIKGSLSSPVPRTRKAHCCCVCLLMCLKNTRANDREVLIFSTKDEGWDQAIED